MSNIDKPAQRMRDYLNTAVISGVKLLHLTTDELSGLLDELESAEHTAAVDHEAACSLVEENEELKRRIAELEAEKAELRQLEPDGWITDSGKWESEGVAAAYKKLFRHTPHPRDIPFYLGKPQMKCEPIATLDVQSGRADGNKFALVYSSAAHKLPDDVYYLHVAAAGIGKGE